MNKQLSALLAIAVFVLTPLAALSAPDRQAPAPPAGQDDAPGVRFYVDLVVSSGDEAASLARLIPDWDEALEAGSTRVILPQADIDRLQALGYGLQVVGPAPAAPDAWPACYSRLDDLYGWLQSYAAAHPTRIELMDHGDSWCKLQGGCTTTGGQLLPGDDLWVAKITNELATGPKEGRFFVDAGIHARELPTAELAKAFIQTLVEGYGSDPDVTWLMDQREVYVVLSTNPDGRRLVEMGVDPPYSGNPWYWRKNGNNGIAGSSNCLWPPSSGNQYGIDLNRNHIFKWDAPGHSNYVCDQTYRGLSAGSEPEIQAYEGFVRSIIPDQRPPGDTDPAPLDTTGFLINLHNVVSGGVVLVPWGWTTTPSPNNAQLEAIAQKITTYNGYAWQHALYPVSGNTRDWAYGELGIPAYVIEMDGNDFFTSCSLLPGIISNMLPALHYAATISDLPYMRVYGPDARHVSAFPGTVVAGADLDVTAQINDTQNGNQTITAAEYYVLRPGDPPPGGPGTGIAMAASDGTFNSPVEVVEATASTAGLGRGRHLVLVRGRDVSNNWGPFSADLFEVTCFYADMDCSGTVDVLDIVATAEAVQNAWTYGSYDPVYDVNEGGAGDGILDIQDVQIVAANFNLTVP